MRTFRKTFENKQQATCYYNRMSKNNYKGFNSIVCFYEIATSKWVIIAH